MNATADSLDVPGACLHYRVRGSGPMLLLSGAASSVFYEAMASRLARTTP